MTFVKNSTVIKVDESLGGYAFNKRRYMFLTSNVDKIVYFECGGYSGPVTDDFYVTSVNMATGVDKTAVYVKDRKTGTTTILEDTYAVFILKGRHDMRQVLKYRV